jgi:hypothetical protein
MYQFIHPGSLKPRMMKFNLISGKKTNYISPLITTLASSVGLGRNPSTLGTESTAVKGSIGLEKISKLQYD